MEALGILYFKMLLLMGSLACPINYMINLKKKGECYAYYYTLLICCFFDCRLYIEDDVSDPPPGTLPEQPSEVLPFYTLPPPGTIAMLPATFSVPAHLLAGFRT